MDVNDLNTLTSSQFAGIIETIRSKVLPIAKIALTAMSMSKVSKLQSVGASASPQELAGKAEALVELVTTKYLTAITAALAVVCTVMQLQELTRNAFTPMLSLDSMKPAIFDEAKKQIKLIDFGTPKGVVGYFLSLIQDNSDTILDAVMGSIT